MKVDFDAAMACGDIVFSEDASRHERDAAAEALRAHKSGEPVDYHIAYVLWGYVRKQYGAQNRWGK